ncbi:MAG: hypothetical protein AAB545_00990 [Patescibacteria group bacterium]
MNNVFSLAMGALVIILISGAGYFYLGESPAPEQSLEVTPISQEEGTTPKTEEAPAGGVADKKEVSGTNSETKIETGTKADNKPGVTSAPIETKTPKTLAVTYTDSGFTPNTLEIHVGDSVTFAKEGLKVMWVASAPHPVHTDFPAFDQKKTGDSYTFTFTKIGTFKYHNHVAPGNNGIITVK